jgi:aryl-alcohol dehydrogenase-like predicted oxidoreductase
MDFTKLYAKAATPLGRYRILSPKCGLRVSPLQLGAMSLGDAQQASAGSTTKENAFRLLDAYVAAGGNFIDTSNNYQNEQSEGRSILLHHRCFFIC